ncbi:MAG: 1,4-dihydroxy-6-naphthoate synthase [Planctomycetota bacterium]
MSGDPRFRFGFSPCPNDTFAFWAAVHGAIDSPIAFEPELADIETLNERAVSGRDAPEVTKLSLPALARCIDRYAVLNSGAALGFGCGPLVVCRDPAMTLGHLSKSRVAIPGHHTTANLLMASLLPKAREVVAMRFDEIMPAVASGDCDAGLVIHESRFTYADHGLCELADLGVLWERETNGPLPLGVICARRDLSDANFLAIETALRESVRLARREPERARAWIREHAQEMADDVCDQHIALYVNDFSEDLGEVGRQAIDELLSKGRAAGLLPAGGSAYREASA